MPTQRMVRVFKVGAVLVSVVIGLLILAFAVDTYYRRKFEAGQQSTPLMARMDNLYKATSIHHIHPVYLFFYPYDAAKRRTVSNPSVTIDPDGFRGPGPSHAGGKKLAFILGGSGAFGYGSTSDATTITGYLNQLQSEYFFVNAAVSSWITTQELHRVAYQLLEHKPALIISVNGFNDISSAADYRLRGKEFSVGTPQSFDALYALVGDIESNECKKKLDPWYRRWYPSLSWKLFGPPDDNFSKQVPPEEVFTPALSTQIANRYAMNVKLMHAMSAAMGTRYIGVFQPVSKGLWSPEWDQFVRDTSERMVKHKYELEYHDFRDVFARVMPKVPPPASEGGDDKGAVFLDPVHLTDAGAKVVAEQLLPIIRAQPAAIENPAPPPPP